MLPVQRRANTHCFTPIEMSTLLKLNLSKINTGASSLEGASSWLRQVFHIFSPKNRDHREYNPNCITSSWQKEDKGSLQTHNSSDELGGEREEKKNGVWNHFYTHDTRGSRIHEQGLPYSLPLWSDCRRDGLFVFKGTEPAGCETTTGRGCLFFWRRHTHYTRHPLSKWRSDTQKTKQTKNNHLSPHYRKHACILG